MDASTSVLMHVMSLEEIGWGIVLIAATMTIHALAMPATLVASRRLRAFFRDRRAYRADVIVLLAGSWMIVVTHLVEVVAWALFFLARDAFPTISACYYYALLQYTTVGSELALPDRWRLLGGMIAMAGLLTFAWSTAVLLTLAQPVQDEGLQRIDPNAAGGP